MIADSAVRSLRKAVIDALKDGVPSVNGRVYTPPAPANAVFPYLVVGNYNEKESNFNGRMGSLVTFDVKGFVRSEGGDAPLLEVFEECYQALHQQGLDIDGHLHLEGKLRLQTTYLDPDGRTLQFVARYTGETKNA